MEPDWEYILERKRYEDELVINPNNTDTLLELSELLEEHFSDHDGARQCLERALEIDPAEAEAHQRLGSMFTYHYNDYLQARAHFEAAVAADPNDAISHELLATLLAEHFNERQAAADHYQQALQADPLFEKGYFSYGSFLMDEDPEKARDLLQTALDLSPRDTDAMYNMALLMVSDKIRDYGQARALYEQIIEIDPEDHEAHNFLANLLDDHFDEQEMARSLYEKAIALDPDYATAYYDYGLMCKRLGEKEAARRLLEQSLRLNPGGLSALTCLADLVSDTFGEPEEGLKLAERAVQLAPENPDVRNCYAEMLAKTEKIAEAIAEYEKVIAMDPANTDALVMLANLLDDHYTNYEAATALYEKATALAPGNPWVYNEYGIMAKRSGDYAKAKEKFEQAAQLDPDNATPRAYLANLLALTLNDCEAAIPHYELALALTPRDHDIRLKYALALERTERNEEAKTQYLLLLGEDNDNAAAHNNLANVLSDKFREYEQARTHHIESLRIDPQDAMYHFNYALLCLELGDYNEARAQFEAVITIEPEHVRAIWNLASLLTTHYNLTAEALALYERALQLEPESAELQEEYRQAQAGKQEPDGSSIG